MRILGKALVAGAAVIAIGMFEPALAQTQTPQIHVMTIRLPDGGLAQIRYVGDVAPQVTFAERPAADGAIAPLPGLFVSASPFAMIERISTEMDRQAAAMLRQVDALAAQAQSGQLTEAVLRDLPAGGRSYSFVSTMSGNGVCSQSVEITSQGNGAPPRVVRHSAGNCGSGPAGGAVALPAVPAPAARPDAIWTGAPQAPTRAVPAAPGSKPDLILTNAAGRTPYAGLVREIPAAQR